MTGNHAVPEKARLRYRESSIAVRFWVARAAQRSAGRIELVPESHSSFPYFLLLQLPDGRVFEDLSAFVRVKSEFEDKLLPLKLQFWMPHFFALVEWLLQRLLIRQADIVLQPLRAASGYGMAGRAYLRAMGLIYAAAFASALMQMPGLVGQRGLLPLERFPVYGWQGAGADWAVLATCWLGLAAALALTLRRLVFVASLSAFSLYSLLISAGGDFFAFSFDYYILETGFLAILLSPFASRRSAYVAAPRLLVWYIWWLLLRLFLFPVINQLGSGSTGEYPAAQVRNDLMCQPLPTAMSWWVAQSPNWQINALTTATTAFSIMIMLALVLGKKWRPIAGLLIAMLSAWTMLVSNGALSSWITLALALFCFDDRWFRRPVARFSNHDEASSLPGGVTLPAMVGTTAALLWLLSALYIAEGYGSALPRTGEILLRLANQNRLMLSHVGMGRPVSKRPEVIIEGSRDGKNWKPYNFEWKPGMPKQAPRVTCLYHPRLDWQLWFPFTGNSSYWLGSLLFSPPAQIGHSYEWKPEPFLLNLVDGIRRNQPEILQLLGTNPFPGMPPRFIRLQLYDYTFCSAKDHSKTGRWWNRRLLGALDLEKEKIYPYQPPPKTPPAAAPATNLPSTPATKQAAPAPKPAAPGTPAAATAPVPSANQAPVSGKGPVDHKPGAH